MNGSFCCIYPHFQKGKGTRASPFLVELPQEVGIFLSNLGCTEKKKGLGAWEGCGNFRDMRGAFCEPQQEQQQELTFVTSITGYKALHPLSTPGAVAPGPFPYLGFRGFAVTGCTAIHSDPLWSTRDLPPTALEGRPVKSDTEPFKNKKKEGSNDISGGKQGL